MSRSSDESRQSSDGSEPRFVEGLGWIERRVAPFAHWFGETAPVLALRESLPVSFGGLLLALAALAAFVEPGSIVDRLRASIPGAFAVMSVVLVLVLSVRLAQRMAMPVAAMLGLSIVAFVLALPHAALRSFATFAATLGTSGLFTAIVCCLATAGALSYGRKRDDGSYPYWMRGGAFILCVSSVLFALHVSVAALLATLLSPLGLLGDSFIALFLITAIEAILWLFGIHGPALLAALVLPVYLKFQFENTAAFAHHEALPHLVAVSTFLFVFPGGAGATLPLVALLLRSRVPRLRKFAYATILPSLVNVNEPVMFGLPIVYNPILGIPFVLAPLVLVCTTYAALALQLVRAPIYYVPSTLPLFVNVMLATFDWRSCVLIVVNVAIAGAIYLPFVRMYERIETRRAQLAESA
jgi:PTS system cellobiose-specific IIC component